MELATFNKGKSSVSWDRGTQTLHLRFTLHHDHWRALEQNANIHTKKSFVIALSVHFSNRMRHQDFLGSAKFISHSLQHKPEMFRLFFSKLNRKKSWTKGSNPLILSPFLSIKVN
jgi:hypothetical protein